MCSKLEKDHNVSLATDNEGSRSKRDKFGPQKVWKQPDADQVELKKIIFWLRGELEFQLFNFFLPPPLSPLLHRYSTFHVDVSPNT